MDVEEIGYELYQKNGDQMWESYKKYSSQAGVEYDDALIRQSIERTYDIAHNRIEKFMPDNTVRLPDFVVPVGPLQADFSETMYGRCSQVGLADNIEYAARLDER